MNTDEFAFDDNGQLVPIFQPPQPPPEIALLDALTDATGIPIPRSPAVLEILQNAFDAEGDRRAGEGLARIAARLGDSIEAVVLRRAILGADEPLRKTAEKHGISHVAVHKRVKRVEAKLAGLTSPPLVEGRQNDGQTESETI